MSEIIIVVDTQEDWAPYYPSDRVVTFAEYLAQPLHSSNRTRVINLCSDYEYLHDGYYCSLLAEARDHNVIPAVRTLNDLSSPGLYQMQLLDIRGLLEKTMKGVSADEEISIISYFGTTENERYQGLAKYLFDRLPCPIFCFTLKFSDQWLISDIKIISHASLDDDQQTFFAGALDKFSQQIWRKKRSKKQARYDLALLCNETEKLPPSNKGAIKKFISAGKSLGVNVQVISPSDYVRLPEFDGLFIRETTAIDHHTYKFAKKAEAEGMVVIDDSASILKCTNKIYLENLFTTHQVPTPRTMILQKDQPDQLAQAIETLGLPLVIKIPDGAFSKGIEKVKSFAELEKHAQALFEKSSLLLAQEYLYTEFDWRIGILDNKPLYACRYYMVKNHWQIYRHGNKTASGGFDTLPTFETPKYIIQAALKATKYIGNSLYGVDIKESGGKGYVIEVNDNPSIDSGVEDKYLGNQLYTSIIEEFVNRFETKHQG